MFKFFVYITLFFAFTTSVFSQVNTWVGGTDTDWHKPCNWSLNTVPTCAHHVVIPTVTNNPVITALAHCDSLSITSTNVNALTINSTGGAQLYINSTNNGPCAGTPTVNTGCIVPITADFNYTPSVNLPENTFTELLNVVDPAGTSDISKSIKCIVSNISGGDGGPYTVDFSNVNYGLTEAQCAGGSSLTGALVLWWRSGNASSSASQGTTGSAPATAVVNNVTSTGAGLSVRCQWSGLPNSLFTGVSHTYNGSITITDGSSNSLTINLPSGSSGVTNPSAGTYSDSWNITRNSQPACP